MKQKESTMHIMIIWSNATEHRDFIIDDLNKEFCIIKIFKFYWDKKLFFQNLSIFYSHSLKDKSYSEMNEILKNKCKSVGNEGFYAIVFEDKHPIYQERKTTSGSRIVNTHIFDKKMAFRKMTGGGSRIHCSDDSWETNKDLTILMGLNLEDFLTKYPNPSTGVEEFHTNCIGVGGYDSIQQLFYILNNTIKYCVLRNHECIPDEYTVEGHGDIDLLVEHKNYAVRLTGAHPVFPQDYRVYHIIKIAGKEVPFDFRYIGDNYYDPKWEEVIIESRILRKNLFYAPNPINQYYSLLYHAYVQKPFVKSDYLPKLTHYGTEIDVEFNSSLVESIKQLEDFLKKSGYHYVRPNDRTVYYNNKNINNLRIWNELVNNPEIKDLKSVNENYVSLSSFYYFRASYSGTDAFIKYGGIGESCKNEFIRTEQAYKISPEHFVRPIDYREGEFGNFCIYEWIDSVPIEEYLSHADSKKKENVKRQMIEIYNALQKANVMHRDIRPGNIIVEGDVLKLIDFQYAIDLNNPQELECVKKDVNVAIRLGNKDFKYKPYAWKDSASIINCLKYFNIDTSDIKLAADKPFYMSIYKCYKYKTREMLSRIKMKITRMLKL